MNRIGASRIRFRMLLLLAAAALPVGGQSWDPGTLLSGLVSSETDSKLKLTFESRFRYEDRTDQFGTAPDKFTGLIRTRVGLSYTPVSWLKFSGMVQDARAPWYGENAPSNERDPANLQEGYIELLPNSKEGFGMTAGREMLNYGEGRLIGIPDWTPLSRTYDNARMYYRFSRMRVEFLMLSPVQIQLDAFNRPILGNRVWGTYDSLPGFQKDSVVEFYVLRHDQNRPGGFTGGSSAAGTDRLETNTFGFRATGPVGMGIKYSMEGALQNGWIGPAEQSAGAWFSGLSRGWKVADRPFDLSCEYKFASGTNNPKDAAHSGTFDQLYPANHDKFGDEDLFGWKNQHDVRALASYGVVKKLTVNFMYNNIWLASVEDGLYNSSGSVIASSANGTAGRHVGQETDVFATYRYSHFLVGAGYGHFYDGEFIRNTMPHAGPNYAYLFHTYSF